MRLAIPAATIGVMSIVVTAFAGDRPLRPAGLPRDARRSEPVIHRRMEIDGLSIIWGMYVRRRLLWPEIIWIGCLLGVPF